MKIKIKISSIILLALVSLPYLLLLVFFIQQKNIQHEKSEALEHGPVVTLKIDVSDVRWFKQNKELIIDNKLFDVKDHYQRDGKLVVRGFFDGDETELLEKLHQLSRNKELSSVSFFSLLLSAFSPLNDVQQSAIQIAAPDLNSEYNFFLPEMYAAVVVPPPQAA